MAQIQKPDYSKITSRSQVYNVRPQQEAYRGADPNAGQVDLSTGQIFDKLVDSIGNFTELHLRSEQTANQLQARDIINKKIKHTQNLKELLFLHLPNTKYQDLKLGDVLSKVRKMDLEGKSDLNIGATNEHNVSIMQLPENLNPEVKAMVEDTFIKQDSDFLSSLMGQVENVQSEQATLILSNLEADFKSGLSRDYYTTNSRSEGNDLAIPRLNTLFAEIDALAKTNSWSALEIEGKKQSAGQMMLQAEFDQSFNRLGTNTRTSEDVRKQVMEMAKEGSFHYLNEHNEKIYLNSDYYKDKVFNEVAQERINKINTRKYDVLESQKVNLSTVIRKKLSDGNFKFDLFYRELIENDEFSEIGRDHIFDRLRALEIKQDNKGASDSKIALNSRLLEKLSVITSELSTDSEFEKNISKYAIRNRKTGKWEPKSAKTLRTEFKLPNFEERYIRDHITVYNQSQFKNDALLKSAKNSSLTKEFVSIQSQRFTSIPGIASFITDFGEGKEDQHGNTTWSVDDRKIKAGTPGGQLLSEFNLNEDIGLKNANPKDILATKKHIIQSLLNKATIESKKLNDKLLKDQAGALVKEEDMTARYQDITSSFSKNYQAMVVAGDEVYKSTVKDWKNKKPNLIQTIEIEAYKHLLHRVTDHGQKKNSYDLVQLNTHIKELRDGKINGSPVNKKFASMSQNYMMAVANDLEVRKNNLIKDGRNIGFIETGQEAILEETGKYDMNKWYKWAVKKKLDHSNIQIISSKEADMMQNINDIPQNDALVQYSELFNILSRYGNPRSLGRKVALKNIFTNLPEKYRMHFSLIQEDGHYDPAIIKRIWNHGRIDILSSKSNKAGEE